MAKVIRKGASGPQPIKARELVPGDIVEVSSKSFIVKETFPIFVYYALVILS